MKKNIKKSSKTTTRRKISKREIFIRKAIFFTCFYAIIGSCILFVASKVSASPTKTLEALETRNYVVQKGDTLWTICEGLGLNEKIDIRNIMVYVKKSNGLTTADLVPGQKLVLPKPNK